MKKPKILIATGIYPPDVGGPATHSKLLFDELPRHGVEVEVVSFGSVRHLPKVIRHLAYFFKVLMRGRKVEIIYAQDPVSVGLPALWVAQILHKRFFLRLGGDYAWEQGVARFGVKENLDEFVKNYDKYPFFVRLLKSVQTDVARNAEKVIVPSEYLGTIIQQWEAHKKHKKLHIQAIYNAFMPVLVPESKEELRKKLTLEGSIIISAGRLVLWKGFDMLIEIMPSVREHIPDANLLIAGDGPDYGRLERFIAEQNASLYIKLLGPLPKDELAQYVKAADVFALNTGYEGFSHQLLEVMALKTPVVTTNIGGNRELIENNVSGVLLKCNDKKSFVSTLTDSLKGRINTIDKAYERSQNFTLQYMIEETINVLEI